MSEQFDQFADRVERLLDGEAPTPSEGANPLLRLAANLHEALGAEAMDPAFRARLKAELLERYANNVVPFPSQPETAPRRWRRVRRALVAVSIASAASVALAFGIGGLRHQPTSHSNLADVPKLSATASPTRQSTATPAAPATATPRPIIRPTHPPVRPIHRIGAPGSSLTLPTPLKPTATSIAPTAAPTRISPAATDTPSVRRSTPTPIPSASATPVTVANVTQPSATPVPPTVILATSTQAPTFTPASATPIPSATLAVPSATPASATATNTPPPTQLPATATGIPPTSVPPTTAPATTTPVPSATEAPPATHAVAKATVTNTPQPPATVAPATHTPQPTVPAATNTSSASATPVALQPTAAAPTATVSATEVTGATDTPVAALPSATPGGPPATAAGTVVVEADPSPTAPFALPAVQGQGSPTATPLTLGHDLFPAPALASADSPISGTAPFTPGVLLRMVSVPANPGSLAVYIPSSDPQSPSDLLSGFGMPVTRVLGQAGVSKLVALVRAGNLSYRASLTALNSGYALHLNLLNPVQPRAADTIAATAGASASTFLAAHQLATGAQLTSVQPAGNGNQFVNFTENVPYPVWGAHARVTMAPNGQVLAVDLSWVDTSRAALAPSAALPDALARIASGQGAIHSTGALPSDSEEVNAPSILYVPVPTAGGVYYEPLYQFSGHTFGGSAFEVYVPALDSSYLQQ